MNWVPTKDKLPPCSGIYLAQFKWSKKPDVADYDRAAERENDLWFDSGGVGHRNKDLIAWSKLPRPYRGEEND